MASVFLSYDREDLARARSIAVALDKAGHSVWWDRHITGGSQYSKEIEQALNSAEVVVVLWSEQSVDSPWVRDEAAAGRDRGCLVPVKLDGAEPPLGFRQYQTIDMSSRAGLGRNAQLRPLLQAVQMMSGKKSADEGPSKHDRKRPSMNRGALIVLVALLLAVAAAFLLWRSLGSRSSVPVVAVSGTDASPAARAMAHDLFVKLGSLQSARPDLVELTEQAGADADLVFAVGESRDVRSAGASLVLSDGRSRALLWSKDFELPISQQSDLHNKVAFTAGLALECALEALAGERTGLKRPLSKLYLNACAAIDESNDLSIDRLIPIFRQVTAQAPTFEAGWAKLLLVELLTALNNPPNTDLSRSLNRHIAEARKVNPELAEAYLAEAVLVAPTDHAGRLRLVDLAIKGSPNQPEPFNARGLALRAVGRMNEAAESARRASELDPLSALARTDYIESLAYSGQIERARQELQIAERLWPGSSRLRSTRFALQNRFGDPKDALRLLRLGAESSAPELTELVLRARIEPTPNNIETAVRHAWSLFYREPTRIGQLALTLGAFDREAELFPLLLGPRQRSITQIPQQLFHPTLRELRQDPRFMVIAKRFGQIAYWQQSGKWPDFCFEEDLPYNCRKEASRLTASVSAGS